MLSAMKSLLLLVLVLVGLEKGLCRATEPMEVDQPQKTSSSSTAPTQALISTKTPLLPEEMVDFGDGEIKKWKDHREWRKKNHWERWKLKKYRQNMKRPRVNERKEEHKPNVIYITTSIAAIFFVCFVALVFWHMKETGRVCFRKKESRRNTFNSQQYVAARKNLRTAPAVDHFILGVRSWPVNNERDPGEVDVTKINSVVIENVSVVTYHNKLNEEVSTDNSNTTSFRKTDNDDKVTSTQGQVDSTNEQVVSIHEQVVFTHEQVVSTNEQVVSTKDDQVGCTENQV